MIKKVCFLFLCMFTFHTFLSCSKDLSSYIVTRGHSYNFESCEPVELLSLDRFNFNSSLHYICKGLIIMPEFS